MNIFITKTNLGAKLMKKFISVLAILIVAISLCGCEVIDNLKGKIFSEDEPKTNVITEEVSTDVANAIHVSVYDFDTFNPLTTNSQSVKDAMKFVYEPLFTLDEQITPVPVLADSYTIAEDGKSVTVKLKQNAAWHDGTAFTAADVRYTLNNIINGKTTYAGAVSQISECRIIDNYTISISLRHSMPNPVALFTFPIVKKNTPMEVNQRYMPIGTGPFSYYGKISIDRYMLVASDYYYMGKAKLSGVYIDVVPDNHRYFTMFNSGNSDVCNAKLISGFDYTPKANVRVNDYVSDELIYLGINHSSGDLSNSNVRRAINYFIDRTAIEEDVMYSSVKAVDTFINPMSPYYCGTTGKMRADSVQGVELLQSAGWEPESRGFSKRIAGRKQYLKLRLLVNADSESDVKIGQKVEECLIMNGIDIDIEILPYAEFIQKINSMDYDLYIGAQRMNYSQDISDFLGSAGNAFAYNNVNVDMLVTQMGITNDTQMLKVLYEQMRELLNSDMPVIPIAYKKNNIYTSARIKNVAPVGIDGYYRELWNWSIK